MSAAVARGETETISFARRSLDWRGVTRESEERNVVALRLNTDRGDIIGRYHPVTANAPTKELGVVWVGGAGGGLDGPARGLYVEAAERLQAAGVAGLRLH